MADMPLVLFYHTGKEKKNKHNKPTQGAFESAGSFVAVEGGF